MDKNRAAFITSSVKYFDKTRESEFKVSKRKLAFLRSPLVKEQITSIGRIFRFNEVRD